MRETRFSTPAPKKVLRVDGKSFGGDPLVDGAARLLSIPLRHVYAALWRVGVLEVQACIRWTATNRRSQGLPGRRLDLGPR